MLRFLANENLPGDAIESLTKKGYDIVWIRRDAPGSSDEKVLEKAMKEKKSWNGGIMEGWGDQKNRF
jgi:hypothetical protein